MAGIAKTPGEKIFEFFNYIFLAIAGLTMLAPLVYVVVGSFSSTGLIGGFGSFSIDAYRFIMTTNQLVNATKNSVIITICGTAVNMFMTTLTAYVLSKNYLIGRSVFMKLVVFFMLFTPGLIPNFIVVDSLGLMNTYWAIWLPGAISAYNLIVMKNFFQGIPDSIEESAKMDGCNDIQVFAQIVLPLSKASLATIGLFYAVGHWNNYFNSLIYLKDQFKWPIQVWLRQIVVLSVGGFSQYENLSEFASVPSDSVKYAVIVVSTVPIILIYPFLQKYFTKGVMLGSVKG